MIIPMPDRFPGYDVLAKRHTPSWNETTRRVIDHRLALSSEPRFFTAEEFLVVIAAAARIVPQPRDRPPIPVARLVDHKLDQDRSDGFRRPGMPREREAWRRGVRAMNAEAQGAHGKNFDQLAPDAQDQLLKEMQAGNLHAPEWEDMPPATFFKMRLSHDIVFAYYAHPTAWSEIGWGGPASPRGYVRMGYDERDPWEAAEVKNGDLEDARRKNRHVG